MLVCSQEEQRLAELADKGQEENERRGLSCVPTANQMLLESPGEPPLRVSSEGRGHFHLLPALCLCHEQPLFP